LQIRQSQLYLNASKMLILHSALNIDTFLSVKKSQKSLGGDHQSMVCAAVFRTYFMIINQEGKKTGMSARRLADTLHID